MSVLALTTTARVIAYLGTSNSGAAALTWSPGNIAVLQDMINKVSDDMENYCNRSFGLQSYTTETLLAGPVMQVDSVPVQSITSIVGTASGRSADMATIPATAYDISADGDSITFYTLGRGARVRAVYVGGLAATTADIIANYPALAGACDMQVANLWKRHANPDKTGMTLGNGQTNWTQEYQMLTDVKRTLDNSFLYMADFLG